VESLEFVQAWMVQQRWFVVGFLFVFGAVVGSFLNVVIHRLPHPDLSIVRPRSRCPRCDALVRWYDNIPLLSFALLRARCRGCGGAISWRYPLVELLTAGLAVALFLQLGPGLGLPLYFVFCASLVAISFIDLDHQIIPNEISLPGILAGFGVSFLGYDGFWIESLIGIAVGGGGLLLLTMGWALIRGKWAMGMGDVKLLAMIGAWLGWRALLFVLLFASLQGVLAAVGLLIAGVAPQPPLPDEEDEEAEKERIRSERAAKLGAVAQPAVAEDEPVEAGEGELAEAEAPEEDEAVGFMGSAIPFGPFLSLAAIEYLFFGQLFFDWLSGR